MDSAKIDHMPDPSYPQLLFFAHVQSYFFRVNINNHQIRLVFYRFNRDLKCPPP